MSGVFGKDGELAVVDRGVRAAGGLGPRLLATAATIVSLSLLVGLDTVIPYPSDWTFLGLVLIGWWVVWTITGGAVARFVSRRIADRPESAGQSLKGALGRLVSHVGTPLLLYAALGIFTAFLYLVIQVVKVPGVGWVLLVILSPLVLALAYGIVWAGLRWLLAGHLSSPAVAADDAAPFEAVSRAFAYLRAAPFRVVGYRILGTVLVLGRVLLVWIRDGAILGLVYLLLAASGAVPSLDHLTTIGLDGFTDEYGAVAGFTFSLLTVIAACWFFSAPLAMLHGARGGLYLAHRLRLDKTPLTELTERRGGAKSLEEAGAELVQRLRDEREVREDS